MKRISLLLVGVAVLSLSACSPTDDFSIDFSKFTIEVEETESQARINDFVDQLPNVDAVKGKIDVEKIRIDQYIDYINIAKEDSTAVFDASFDATMVADNINTTDGNEFKAAFNLSDIEIYLQGENYGLETDDVAEMMDGELSFYVKNSLGYLDISNKQIREFLPYLILAGDNNFKDYDSAKAEADKIPDKIYDPNPIFEENTFPIFNFTDEDKTNIGNALKSFYEYNSQLDAKIFTAYSNGKDILYTLDVNGEQMVDIIANIVVSLQPSLDVNMVITLLKQMLTVNSFVIEFVIDKDDNFKYFSTDIDVSIKGTQNDANGQLEAITNTEIVAKTEAYLQYGDFEVNYPKDIDSYVEYVSETK